MSTSDWNTSDGSRLPVDPASSLRQGVEFLPNGVLDPEILARMANEFFRATPDANGVPAHTTSGELPTKTAAHSSPPATVPAMPNEVSLPSDPHFSGLPANAGPAAVAPVALQYHASPPVIPGVVGSAVPSGGPPGFSFLQEARPILPSQHVQTPDIYPAAMPINEFVNPEPAPIELTFPLDDVSLPRAGYDLQPPTPTVPCAFGSVDSSAFPAFSFLEEARPLFSASPSIPGPVPTLPEIVAPTDPQFSKGVTNRPESSREALPLRAAPLDFLGSPAPSRDPLRTVCKISRESSRMWRMSEISRRIRSTPRPLSVTSLSFGSE